MVKWVKAKLEIIQKKGNDMTNLKFAQKNRKSKKIKKKFSTFLVESKHQLLQIRFMLKCWEEEPHARPTFAMLKPEVKETIANLKTLRYANEIPIKQKEI